MEAHHRITDGVHHAAFDVGHAPDPVDDLAILDVVKQRVDGEVTPRGVFVGVTEDVVVADQEVFALALVGFGRAPEGRGLDDLAAGKEHVDQAEASADDPGVAEQRAHVVGTGAGRDVEVLGAAIEQQIADSAADDVGLVAVAKQAPHDLDGVGVQAAIAEVDGVTRRCDARRLHFGRRQGQAGTRAPSRGLRRRTTAHVVGGGSGDGTFALRFIGVPKRTIISGQ